jgi:hypothetical protein
LASRSGAAHSAAAARSGHRSSAGKTRWSYIG